MQKADWLFFDLGSSLIDETEAYARRIRETVSGTSVTVSGFTELAASFWAQGLQGYSSAVKKLGLNKAPWHSEEEHPYDGCAGVLHVLQRRGYRLGIIANQLPGTEKRLQDWGLLRFFDVIAASAELGISKPDPAIFLWALKSADCKPKRAVMIGDRIDNDILPAKALGMQTVRILQGPTAHYMPGNDPSDAVICSLSDLPDRF